MTARETAPLAVTDVIEIDPTVVLGVSTSLKSGANGRRSAARGLLVDGLERLASVYPTVRLLDLAVRPLPSFDGRFAHERDDENLGFVAACVERSGALLLSVPSYWAGVSGVFKNFVDVLCGPAYDLPEFGATPFAGKPTGVVVVGADELSAVAGAEQVQAILASVGARLIGEPVTVANPRLDSTRLVAAGQETVLVAGLLASELRARENRGTK